MKKAMMLQTISLLVLRLELEKTVWMLAAELGQAPGL